MHMHYELSTVSSRRAVREMDVNCCWYILPVLVVSNLENK